MKKSFVKLKKAFTLAEVLITLVVIGVIAALTIPNIIYETKKHEYSARLKKFYSTMRQVVQRADASGKSWNDWAVGQNVYDGDVDVTIAFQDEYILPYMSYFGTEVSGVYRKVYLNDGSYFSTKKGNCIDFVFDVNGDKSPNESGRDIYNFFYCPSVYQSYWKITDEFIPYQRDYFDRNTALWNCKASAQNCAALLRIDGWEYKSDYPYRL